jgi:hypothetical protein
MRTFQSSIRSEEFNRCWIVCGDRDAIAYLDLSPSGRPRVESLDPGIHILENRPLGRRPRPTAGTRADGRPPEAGAACVHAGTYGTRSAQIVIVPERGAPRIRFTTGPSCEHPWQPLPAGLQYPT